MKIGILDDERSMLLRIRGYVEEARIRNHIQLNFFKMLKSFLIVVKTLIFFY